MASTREAVASNGDFAPSTDLNRFVPEVEVVEAVEGTLNSFPCSEGRPGEAAYGSAVEKESELAPSLMRH